MSELSEERKGRITASEVGAILGLSPYRTAEDVMRSMVREWFGAEREFTGNVATRWGQEHEPAAIKQFEALYGNVLPGEFCKHPDHDWLGATPDGFTILGEVLEVKCPFSQKLFDLKDKPFYAAQVQIQMQCCDRSSAVFVVWTPSEIMGESVERDDGWFQSVLPTLKSFHDRFLAIIDDFELSGHYLSEKQMSTNTTTATPQMQLPAVSVQMQGSIAIISNLDIFGKKLAEFIANIDLEPTDDQGFADAEAAVKTLQTAQDALEQAEASALAQASSIDDMRRTVALYVEQAKKTRLLLEKMVKSRKDQLRVEIAQKAKDEFTAYVAGLNKAIGKPYLSCATPDFAGAMKGKRTLESCHNAVNAIMAQSKVDASESANKIIVNLASLRELAADYAFLFSDTAQIILKANEDLVALIKTRIAEHKEAEQKRLDAEREKIRAEELARIERENKAQHQEPAIAGGPTLDDVLLAATHADVARALRPTHDYEGFREAKEAYRLALIRYEAAKTDLEIAKARLDALTSAAA